MEEKLASLVQEALPELAFGKSEEVAAHLVNEVGITNEERIRYIRETDLLSLLLPVQARIFMAAITPSTGTQNPTQQASASGGNDAGASRRPLSDVPSRENRRRNLTWDFEVDWTDIKNGDKEIMKKLKRGRKLKLKHRKIFVARVVEQVRQRVPAAERKVFIQVMTDVKKKYPESFRHELAGGKVGRTSITFKMMTKFDNEKRPDRKTRVEKEAPTLKAAYGCVQWRAPLPAGQTPRSQEEVRESLHTYFHATRPTAWDWTDIENKMLLTYSSQRRDLNAQAEAIERVRKATIKAKRTGQAVEDEAEVDEPEAATIRIVDRWPFLFQARGIRVHFTQLTQVEFSASIQKFLAENHLKQLLDFLSGLLANNEEAKRTLKKMKKRVKREENEEINISLQFCVLLLLLCLYWKESMDHILMCVEPTTSAEEVDVTKLPKTPVLVVAGTIFKPSKIYFAADSIVLGTAATLLEGIELMFSCYFVMNLVYVPHAQITLEFLQRVVAGINPARGHKRPTTKNAGGIFSSFREHKHLTTFSQKYEEYLAEKEESPEDEEDEDDI